MTFPESNEAENATGNSEATSKGTVEIAVDVNPNVSLTRTLNER
jgi:hypothetical protein